MASIEFGVLFIERVKTSFITIICKFRPTKKANDEVNNIFYEQIDKAYTTILAYDMKLVSWRLQLKW